MCPASSATSVWRLRARATLSSSDYYSHTRDLCVPRWTRKTRDGWSLVWQPFISRERVKERRNRVHTTQHGLRRHHPFPFLLPRHPNTPQASKSLPVPLLLSQSAQAPEQHDLPLPIVSPHCRWSRCIRSARVSPK